MDARAVDAFMRNLKAIVDQASSQPLRPLDFGVSWTRGDDVLTIAGAPAAAFFEMVGELSQRAVWRERVSEEYIKAQLVPILFALRDDGLESAKDLFSTFAGSVENYEIERVAYVPVDQIILEVEQLQVGQVVFRVVDDALLDEFVELFGETAGDEPTRDAGQQGPRERRQRVQEDLGGKVCAEFRVVGEPIRVRERALAETRRALELITCANAARNEGHPLGEAVAALEGEIQKTEPFVHVFTLDRADSYLTRAPRSWPIELNPAVLEQYEKFGFWVLSDLLGRPVQALTEFEQALLRGAHWIAVSQTQVELETRLLNLMTAIETLVGPKGDPIRTAIAEGTALIVAHTYDARIEVKKFIARMYANRSTLSHGGSNPVTHYDVLRLRAIALGILGILVSWRSGLQTKQDLLNWLERARLSGTSLDPPAPLGGPKSLRKWREEQGLTPTELAARIPRPSIDEEAIVRYEQRTPGSIELRFIANGLGIPPESIALPKNEMWVRARGHLFHLSAHKDGAGNWTARVTGWDYHDATEWPSRPIDPDQPTRDSPTVTFDWRTSGYTAGLALVNLADRIQVALERAMVRERLPEDPEDWTPIEVPRHWEDHLEYLRAARQEEA